MWRYFSWRFVSSAFMQPASRRLVLCHKNCAEQPFGGKPALELRKHKFARLAGAQEQNESHSWKERDILHIQQVQSRQIQQHLCVSRGKQRQRVFEGGA